MRCVAAELESPRLWVSGCASQMAQNSNAPQEVWRFASKVLGDSKGRFLNRFMGLQACVARPSSAAD
eukprot:2711586-Amphidinium_carterae.1